MTRQEIKVSTTRIGVLIGKGGSTKREIEEKAGITLSIDSEEGTVVIEGDDPIAVMTATNVVQAINRGFSPERAFRLIDDEDMTLDVIDLTDLAGTTRHLERLRGRIIGKAGSSRAQARGYDQYGDLSLRKDGRDHRPPGSERDREEGGGDACPGRTPRKRLCIP